MEKMQFSPGFRISTFDGMILLAGAAGAILAGQNNAGQALLIFFPIFHFFLFCNVFRIERKKELIWAASFIVSTAFAMHHAAITSALFIGYNLCVAAVLIFLETKTPGYHGIFWKSLNPDLEQWWKNQSHAASNNAADKTKPQ